MFDLRGVTGLEPATAFTGALLRQLDDESGWMVAAEAWPGQTVCVRNDALRPHSPGPCAKTTVTCTLFLADGTQVVGTNACSNPQAVCPRLPGEDYTKCSTICDQQGHAEVQALARVSPPARAEGASAIVTGHTYACRECQEALFAAGVKWLRVL